MFEKVLTLEGRKNRTRLVTMFEKVLGWVGVRVTYESNKKGRRA